MGGGTPSTSDSSNFTEGSGIPWLTPADLSSFDGTYVSNGARQLSEKGLDSSGAKLLPAGSVLFSSRAPIGYCAIAAQPIATNQGFKSFVLDCGIAPEFLWHYLLFSKEYAESLASGTTFKELSGARAAELMVPIAPAVEQRRIGAKLDAIFEQTRAARARLDRLPALLEKLKRSILAAAFRGDLTADWRTAHPDTVPATLLLERARATQRDECNDDTAASGRLRTTPRRRQAQRVDLSELPSLPRGWAWASLADVADVYDPNPSHRYPSYERGEVPLVSTREFDGDDGWDCSSAPLVPAEVFDEQFRRVGYAATDIIMARKGRLGLFRHPPPIPRYAFSHTVFVIKPKDVVHSDYLLAVLRRPEVVRWLEMEMNSNTGVPTLGKSYTESLPIPIAPFAEQQCIVEAIDAAVRFLPGVRDAVSRSAVRCEQVERMSLARAFRGELVPQDPTDEPASVLLERIRAARAAAEPVKQARTPKRKTTGKRPARTQSASR